MSDYDPRHYDQYGNRTNNSDMSYDTADGRGPYILLAILVVIGVIGGILYFNHSPKGDDQQAQAPAASTMGRPTPPALPGVGGGTATPATPANPGGATASPTK
jgi:hypothetical protein